MTLLALPVSAVDADPDLAFVQGMARGEETALEALYRQHGTGLLAYLSAQLGDRGLAEEVLQDVMLAAWHAAAAFRGESRVRTWLFCIAHNRAVNARRRKVLPMVAVDPSRIPSAAPGQAPGALELAHPADGHRSPSAAHGAGAAAVDVRVDVRAALSGLPADQRAVVDLFFAHGLTVDEAASVLAVPPGTVKSRLHRARAALRGRLEVDP